MSRMHHNHRVDCRRRDFDGWSERGSCDKLRATTAGLRTEQGMSGVRVLVGTRKGAFLLTSDPKRDRLDIGGPYFAVWEIYHLKGSPADPNRIYASKSSSWFGQQIQRSNDGPKSLATSEDKPHQDRKAGFLGKTGNMLWIATHKTA